MFCLKARLRLPVSMRQIQSSLAPLQKTFFPNQGKLDFSCGRFTTKSEPKESPANLPPKDSKAPSSPCEFATRLFAIEKANVAAKKNPRGEEWASCLGWIEFSKLAQSRKRHIDPVARPAPDPLDKNALRRRGSSPRRTNPDVAFRAPKVCALQKAKEHKRPIPCGFDTAFGCAE